MTDSRREEVLETIKTILGPRDLNFLLRYLAEEYGEYECDSEPCECCGDYVSEWTFKW